MGGELLSEFVKSKKVAKKTLCQKLSFEHSMPLIGLVIDNELPDDKKEVIGKFLEGSGALDVEIVVVADTDLDSFSFAHVHYIPYSEESRKELLTAADMMVALPFNDLEELFLNGVIPVSHEREGIQNYDPNKETGNGFVYSDSENADHWKIFAGLVRALETYNFPYDWKNMIHSGLESVRG
jgi:hypothetical protein